MSWQVRNGESYTGGARVDLVVCGVASVASTRLRWPTAAVIAVDVDAVGPSASIAALQAGADTCVRGGDVALIAAFVLAIARRTGLLDADARERS